MAHLQITEGRQRRPSFTDQLGSAVNAYSQYSQQKQQAEQEKQQQVAIAQQFPELANLPPEMQKAAIPQLLKGRQKQQDFGRNILEDDRAYNVIKSNFGDKAADIYKSLPTGGKTNFIDRLMESQSRGIGVEEMFSGQQPQGIAQEPINEKPLETAPKEKPTKFEDFDKGLTPRERVKRQEDRYGKNLPLYQASEQKRQGLEAEKQNLDILEELSPQISSIERLNINPSTGQLIIPALASEDAQRFVKTINDFTTKAKDSYGARVTNFDLAQFMARLPTLANSEAGRRQIIQQMKLINEINSAKENALQSVIDEYGGIRMIDFDKAERLADKRSKGRVGELTKQFASISKASDNSYKKQIEERKKIVPQGFVPVQRADGSEGYIPKKELKAFLDVPGNKAL
jgi:hypothetical protein